MIADVSTSATALRKEIVENARADSIAKRKQRGAHESGGQAGDGRRDLDRYEDQQKLVPCVIRLQ